MSIGNANAYQQEVIELRLNYSASSQGGIQLYVQQSSTDADHETAKDMPVDSWTGIAVSFTRETNPTIYVNGVADTWSVTDVDGVGTYETFGGASGAPDTVAFGRRVGQSEGWGNAGQNNNIMAEVSMYAGELSVNKMIDLTTGACALFHMENLIYYNPMWRGDTPDFTSGIDYTLNDSAANDKAHPPMIYPRGMFSFAKTAAAGGGGSNGAALYHHLRNLGVYA
jgi:hypothetical protein